MIIYSVIPEEIIFEEQQQTKQEIQEITYNGVQMVITPIYLTQVKVVRLLSSNPNHFLDAQLFPGAVIDLSK